MIRKKVLIFGASGQIGKYCIRRLVSNNFRVIAVTRNTHQKGYILKTQAPIGFIDIREADIQDNGRIRKLIAESDICLNLIGILFEKGKRNTFQKIHSDFPEKLAKFCKEENKNLIHVSALAVTKARDSKYAISKTEGEKKIRKYLPEATIIKPSIVYSVDDNFTTRFMSVLGIVPFFPLYYNGVTKFTPVHVTDVAELICHVISKEIYSKDIEVIGPEVFSFKEIINKIIKSIDKKRILLPMPLFVAKISASLLQILPNPLITRDQLNLLKYDNVKSENGITNFDIGCPSKIFFEQAIEKYAYNWRQGGEFSVKKTD
tara:strand:+ start:31 stop:984 length:954 start_codon:yes stop_codon:yes gene_type:complete